MKTAKKCSVLVAAVLIALAAAAVSMCVFTAHAAPAAGLYYFVNCGAEEVTDIETAFGLSGAWGSGDRAYGAGDSGKSWGYETAGAAGSDETDSVFASYVTGSPVYKFEAEAGTYQLALGFAAADNASVTIGAEAQEAVTLADKGVRSYTVTLAESGDITVSVSGGSLAFIAVAESGAKILLHAETTSAEVVEYGAPVGGEAAAYYSDGTTGKIALDYSNLSAEDVNKNFMMTEAAASFEGTTAEVKRTLITMPKNLVYFVNCGSVTGDAVAENNDVYYDLNAAVLSKYEDTLINEVIDQEYTGGATWGYTTYSSEFYVSSKQMPAKTGDPYPPPYPYNTIRCTDMAPYAIEYNFTLPEGQYNLYLGTRSHWHARKVTLSVNGEQVENFNLEAKSRVGLYKVAPSAGKLTVKVAGAQLDEGNIAFIAIQPAGEGNDPADVPAAPAAPESLGMGETEFVVAGAVKDTKIQVSLAEKPFSVIYEGVAAEDGDYTVTLDAADLAGIYRLNVAAVSSGGASAYATVFITDITEFTAAVKDTAWTSGNALIDLSAAAASGLARLEVTFDFITESVTLDGETAWTGSYTAAENGVYDFKIYSGNNAFFTRSVTVSNIDREAAILTASVASYRNGKAQIGFTLDSVAGAKSFRVYSMGKKIAEQDSIPKTYEAAAGEYTFAVTTQSGKIASSTVTVTDKPTGFKPQIKATNSGAQVSVTGRNGSEISKVFAYKTEGETMTRLTVTGTDFNVYESGDYTIMTVYADGSNEITCITVTLTANGAGGGLPGYAVALIVVSCVVVAGGIGALVFFLIRRKKSAKTQTAPPQSKE